MRSMSPTAAEIRNLALDYTHAKIGEATILHADCLEWLGRIPSGSIHGFVTDPPYGVKEYEFDQIEKRANGNGGIWRIPPSFDGSNSAAASPIHGIERTRAQTTVQILLRMGQSGRACLATWRTRHSRLQFVPCSVGLWGVSRGRIGISRANYPDCPNIARRRPAQKCRGRVSRRLFSPSRRLRALGHFS